MELSKIEVIGDKNNPVKAQVLIDGRPIKGVKRISFEHSAGDIPEVQIGIDGFEIDIYALESIISTERAKVSIRYE